MNNLRDYRSQFLSQVHAAYRALSTQVAQVSDEVDSNEGHMLSYVLRYGPCAVGKLAQVFGIKGATLTGTLDRLESRGLLSRALNPDDRRSLLAQVTPRGRALVRRIGARVMEVEAAVRQQVSDRDYAAFLRVIETIKQTQPTGVSHAQ